MKVVKYNREGNGRYAWHNGAHLIDFRTAVSGKYKHLSNSPNGVLGSVNIARDFLFDGIDSLVRAYFLPKEFHNLDTRKINGESYYNVDNTHAYYFCQDFSNPDERKAKEINLSNGQVRLKLKLIRPHIPFFKTLLGSGNYFNGEIKLVGRIIPDGHYSVSTDIAYLLKDIAEKIPDRIEMRDNCMSEDSEKVIKAMLFQKSAGTQVRVDAFSDRFHEMEEEYNQVRGSILGRRMGDRK